MSARYESQVWESLLEQSSRPRFHGEVILPKLESSLYKDFAVYKGGCVLASVCIPRSFLQPCARWVCFCLVACFRVAAFLLRRSIQLKVVFALPAKELRKASLKAHPVPSPILRKWPPAFSPPPVALCTFFSCAPPQLWTGISNFQTQLPGHPSPPQVFSFSLVLSPPPPLFLTRIVLLPTFTLAQLPSCLHPSSPRVVIYPVPRLAAFLIH